KRVVAAHVLGPLQLAYFRPSLGDLARGGRARAHLRHVDHAKTGERLRSGNVRHWVIIANRVVTCARLSLPARGKQACRRRPAPAPSPCREEGDSPPRSAPRARRARTRALARRR